MSFPEYRIESFVPGSEAEPIVLARSCEFANGRSGGSGRSSSVLIYLPKQQRVFTRIPPNQEENYRNSSFDQVIVQITTLSQATSCARKRLLRQLNDLACT